MGVVPASRVRRTGYADRAVRWLLRAAPLLYFGGTFLWGVADFQATDPLATTYQFLTLAYVLTLAAMYVPPGRGAAQMTGMWWERGVALLSANLLIPLSLLPYREVLPYPAIMTLLVVANLLSWWALLTLRTSFSLTPEARRLVTGGPYRVVRHPLYVAGALVGIALLGTAWSVAGVGVFALYLTVTVVRAKAEERVLRAAFPREWSGYARRVRF